MTEHGSDCERAEETDPILGNGKPETTPRFLKLPKFLEPVMALSMQQSIGACVLLSLQNSAYTLLRRYSTGVLHEQASSQAILAVGEMIKMSFSILMIAREHAADPLRPAVRGFGIGWLLRTLYRLTLTSAKMAVPAIIFLAMNLLSFVSLGRISASAFTLIQQSKIVFTAVLSRLLLSKAVNMARWRALLTLLFAVLIICHQLLLPWLGIHFFGYDGSVFSRWTGPLAQACASEAKGTTEAGVQALSSQQARAYVVGVAAVTTEAALSGLSNVYFEKVLKSTSLSLWERNVQLAGYSLLIYVPMAYSAPPFSLFQGWSPLTVLVACLGAMGGILIGLVLKFCDSIVKNLALSTAIITTAVVDSLYFNGPMNLPIVAAAGTVIVSIANYAEAG